MPGFTSVFVYFYVFTCEYLLILSSVLSPFLRNCGEAAKKRFYDLLYTYCTGYFTFPTFLIKCLKSSPSTFYFICTTEKIFNLLMHRFSSLSGYVAVRQRRATTRFSTITCSFHTKYTNLDELLRSFSVNILVILLFFMYRTIRARHGSKKSDQTRL